MEGETGAGASLAAKSLSAVEIVPNRENPSEKQQRLAAARRIFAIVSRVDKNLSDRLLNVFISESGAGAENQEIAEALIESALSAVDKNPQRAVELGTISLRFGFSSSFANLIWHLQARSPDLASKLFLSAIAVARENRNERWLALLGFTAFAETDDSSNLKSALPPALQTELLKLYIEFLQATPINEENQKLVCRHVSSFIIPFQAGFNRLLPVQAEQIKPIIGKCQAIFTPLQKEAADQSSEARSLKTIEDYLSAADEEEDLQVKTVYQYKAAQMAAQQRNYPRAVSILEAMSEELRRLLRNTWEGHRWEWAAELALQLFKQGAELEMYQVLEKVPSDLRGFAQIALADRLPDKTPAAFTVELLSGAQTNLARSKRPPRERFEGYLMLMRLFARHKQIDAAAEVLKQITKLVNQASEEASENKRDNLTISLEDEKLFLEGIPALIFERREYAVRDAINSINLLPGRLLARLDLISLCLAEYKTLSAAQPKTK